MKLSELLQGLECEIVQKGFECEITSLTSDSRKEIGRASCRERV